jgi:hypothetical protein
VRGENIKLFLLPQIGGFGGEGRETKIFFNKPSINLLKF